MGEISAALGQATGEGAAASDGLFPGEEAVLSLALAL